MIGGGISAGSAFLMNGPITIDQEPIRVDPHKVKGPRDH